MKKFIKSLSFALCYIMVISIIPSSFLMQRVQALDEQLPYYINFTNYYARSVFQTKDNAYIYGGQNGGEMNSIKLVKDNQLVSVNDDSTYIRSNMSDPTTKNITGFSDSKIYNFNSENNKFVEKYDINDYISKTAASIKEYFSKQYPNNKFASSKYETYSLMMDNKENLWFVYCIESSKDNNYNRNYFLANSEGFFMETSENFWGITFVCGNKTIIKDQNNEDLLSIYEDKTLNTYTINDEMDPSLEKENIFINASGNLVISYLKFRDYPNRNEYIKLVEYSIDKNNNCLTPVNTINLDESYLSFSQDINKNIWAVRSNGDLNAVAKLENNSFSDKFIVNYAMSSIDVYDDNKIAAYGHGLGYTTIIHKPSNPIDNLYKAAYDSVMLVTDKSNRYNVKPYFDASNGGPSNTKDVLKGVNNGLQKDILLSRKVIDLLPDSLLTAKQTFSSVLDNYQHPIYERIVFTINNAQNNPNQSDVATARYLIKDIPEIYKVSYSSALDDIQMILFQKAINAVEKAEQTKLSPDINYARSAVYELRRIPWEFSNDDIYALIDSLTERLDKINN